MSLYSLFASSSGARCNEFNLVLHAVNISSEVVKQDQRFHLLVDESQALAAYTQLRLYLEENAEQDIITKPLRPFSHGFAGAYLYGLILLVIGALKSTNTFSYTWQSSGLANSVRIMDGEWWRTITALSLHADAAHLAANIGFGALFGILVSRHIGSGAAWFSILVAGALGNALNAFLYQTTHLSIGASTMVFAALGILGVFAFWHRQAHSQPGWRRWAPFLATFALLGFVGTGGENTDIMAHLSGYLCGCLAGAVWLFVTRRDDRDIPAQSWFTAATLGLIVLAWTLALNR